MREQAYDIIVVGAGPAGTAFAVQAARNNLRVLLIHRPAERKYHFEIVSPEDADFLRRCGVPDPAESSVGEIFGIVSRWTDGLTRHQDFSLGAYGPGLLLDRNTYLNCLHTWATANAVDIIVSERIHLLQRQPIHHWTIKIGTAKDSMTFHGRILADASGRSSVIARRLGAIRRRTNSLIAVQYLGIYHTPQPDDRRVRIESVHHGWWFAVQIDPFTRLACFFTDPGLARPSLIGTLDSFSEKMADAPGIAAYMQKSQIHHDSIRNANTSFLDPPFGQFWLSLGDAAVAVDPLCGMGLSTSIKGAIHAARSLVLFDAGELTSYGAFLKSTLDNALREQAKWYSYTADKCIF